MDLGQESLSSDKTVAYTHRLGHLVNLGKKKDGWTTIIITSLSLRPPKSPTRLGPKSRHGQVGLVRLSLSSVTVSRI